MQTVLSPRLISGWHLFLPFYMCHLTMCLRVRYKTTIFYVCSLCTRSMSFIFSHYYADFVRAVWTTFVWVPVICVNMTYIVLQVLRSHDLPGQSPRDVFWGTVIGKIMYCAPVWHGFCSASDYSRLYSFLRRCINLVTPADIQRLSLKCSKMLTMLGES